MENKYTYDLVDRDIIISLKQIARKIYKNHKHNNHKAKYGNKQVNEESRVNDWFYGLAGQYCAGKIFKRLGYEVEDSLVEANGPDKFDIKLVHPKIPDIVWLNEIKTQPLRLLVDPFKNEPIDEIPTSIDVTKNQMKRYLKNVDAIHLMGWEHITLQRGYKFHLLGYITPEELLSLKPRTQFGNRVVNHRYNDIAHCCYVDSPEFRWHGGIERKTQLIEKKVKWLPLNLEP